MERQRLRALSRRGASRDLPSLRNEIAGAGLRRDSRRCVLGGIPQASLKRAHGPSLGPVQFLAAAKHEQATLDPDRVLIELQKIAAERHPTSCIIELSG